MPATSQAQQKLFGMALAVRHGKLDRSKVSQAVLDIVDSKMSDDKIDDFASTVHADLTKKKNSESMTSLVDHLHESLNELFGSIETVEPCVHYRKDLDSCTVGCKAEKVIKHNNCTFLVSAETKDEIKRLQTRCKCYA